LLQKSTLRGLHRHGGVVVGGELDEAFHRGERAYAACNFAEAEEVLGIGLQMAERSGNRDFLGPSMPISASAICTAADWMRR